MPKTKVQIRKEIRDILNSADEEELELQSKKICSSFLESRLYKESDAILSYMPMQKEASPLSITGAAIKDGKLLALPRVVPNTSNMDFYLIKKDLPLKSQLTKGAWNIEEPYPCCENFLSLAGKCKRITMIVPGVAFTKDGVRLGHGKGFYDIYIKRLLEEAGKVSAKVTLAGLCFDFQLLPFIPCEDHDARMDLIL